MQIWSSGSQHGIPLFHIFPLGSAMRVLVATFLDSPSAKARILSAVRRLIYQDKTPLQAIAVHGLFVKVENQKCGIPSGLVDLSPESIGGPKGAGWKLMEP